MDSFEERQARIRAFKMLQVVKRALALDQRSKIKPTLKNPSLLNMSRIRCGAGVEEDVANREKQARLDAEAVMANQERQRQQMEADNRARMEEERQNIESANRARMEKATQDMELANARAEQGRRDTEAIAKRYGRGTAGVTQYGLTANTARALRNAQSRGGGVAGKFVTDVAKNYIAIKKCKNSGIEQTFKDPTYCNKPEYFSNYM